MLGQLYEFLIEKGWIRTAFQDETLFIRGEQIEFKESNGRLSVHQNDAKIQTFKGSFQEIANKVDTFLNGYYFEI